MCGIFVCTRGSCQFRFSKLEVARDVANSSALQTGVIDLLIVLARAAALSERHEVVFDPFPTLVDQTTGTLVCSPENKNITLCRDILRTFPLMKNLATMETKTGLQEILNNHHPLAQSMFNFIVSSNRSVLIKIPTNQAVGFMKCKHQFRLIMQSAEREDKFQLLKKEHGSRYAFHGSHQGNWYSIMRNGLRNASNTNLMVNGAAYDSGIYISPTTSISKSYSWMHDCGKSEHELETARKKHFEEDYIDPTAGESDEAPMKLIAICEVIPKDLRDHDDIWVQPHEECVVTRFLFCYTHDHQSDDEIVLTKEENIQALDEVLALA